MVKFKNIKKNNKKQKPPKKQEKKEVKTEKKTAEIKQTKERKSPSIYRIITERRFWLHVIEFLAIIGSMLVAFGFWQYIEKAQAINMQRKGVESHIQYLQDLTKKYPGDRDIYFQMASDEYTLGNIKQADQYIEKALVLDPNYLPALKLKGYILTQK